MDTTIITIFALPIAFFAGIIIMSSIIFKYFRKIHKDKVSGREKLKELRIKSYTPENIKTILYELKEILEEISDLSDEYFSNYTKIKNNPITIALNPLKSMPLTKQQVKLENKMNYSVVAEWIPRITYLKEQRKMFRNDYNCILYNAFKEFENEDENIRNLKLSKITSQALYNTFKSSLNITLNCMTIGALLALVSGGVVLGAINKGGKDMFKGTKNSDKWIDLKTGKEFDHYPGDD